MLRDRLGISEKQFRQLVRYGVICSSKRSENNSVLYSEETMQRLLNLQADGSLFKVREENIVAREPIMPTTYTPEDGVKVLEMLAAETPLLQIVLQTKLLPATVKRIQQDYDDLVGSVTIPKIILDQMNRCTHLNGTFPLRTATAILTVMQNAEQDRTCPTCEKAPSESRCFGCIKEKILPTPPESGTTNSDDESEDEGKGESDQLASSSSRSQNSRQV